MRDKYLYFGLNAAGTEAFNNVDCSSAQTFQLTTGFVNPIPTGINFLANGGAKVTITAHANHSFGTAYGSPTAGDEVTFLDARYTFDTNNLTVGRNSSNIVNAAADLTVATEGAGFTLVFSGDATVGWTFKDK